MIVGFTGTRKGMSPGQLAAVRHWLKQHPDVTEVHHGGAIGADAEFHRLCAGRVRHVHWSDRESQQAMLEIAPLDLVYPPKPPLRRNLDIVVASHLLLATPEHDDEQQRSGTWATIRTARLSSVPRLVVRRHGDIEEES